MLYNSFYNLILFCHTSPITLNTKLSPKQNSLSSKPTLLFNPVTKIS